MTTTRSDQPTDAGRDRETATGIVGNVDGYLLGDTARTLANTIALALQQARAEGARQEREACAKVIEARVERCYELAAGALSHEGKQAWMAEGAQLQAAAAAIRAREPREEPSR